MLLYYTIDAARFHGRHLSIARADDSHAGHLHVRLPAHWHRRWAAHCGLRAACPGSGSRHWFLTVLEQVIPNSPEHDSTPQRDSPVWKIN